MKRTTSQWRSVSPGMPLSRAIASAIVSFHCSGLVMKPSESTSTGASAIRVMVISLLLSRGDRRLLLAALRHRWPDAGDVASGQQGVPVDPLEQQLAQVVQ